MDCGESLICSFAAEIPASGGRRHALSDLEAGQEFAVAVRSEYRGVDDPQRAHPQAGGEGGDLFDYATLRRFVADYAALPDFFAPDLELRFDERDHKGRRAKERRDGRKDFGQGNE